ncbi:dynamin family protein [uncultured Helicobacter sp.]|uniref:dynamin family protein n=1 Tax=uncultured Helicobacter sp. TaxID=175537 RepID=UPI002588D41F|nr:dynamin family protein [uncultured Helicobacter sp.]
MISEENNPQRANNKDCVQLLQAFFATLHNVDNANYVDSSNSQIPNPTPQSATINTAQNSAPNTSDIDFTAGIATSHTIASLPPQAKAIILSTYQDNFSIYIKNPIFKAILASLTTPESNPKPHTLESLQSLQSQILLCTDINELNALKPFFLRLSASELLDSQCAQNLIDIFEQHALNKESKPQTQLNLTALDNELESIQAQIAELQIESHFLQQIKSIIQKAKDKHFSIGVTGVLSAGKSTFLNALLGEEILGTSTIPETANLTILKYDTQKYATIHFWTQQEWSELQESTNPLIQDFVKESRVIFQDELETLLQESTRQITLDAISLYTSANAKPKLCNLVKKVEIFTPLSFLQNGVEIVDTPGLDDPIIKREEITKEYVRNCDLLIHVMNASCAASQIDIDFILDALLIHNVARLLIMLTRADLLSPEELHQSLQYTKNSLTTQLHKHHNNNDIHALLKRIEFIPIAGFYALLHKTNRPQIALENGYNLEQTNITKVESYLNTMLFSPNSPKHKDILFVAYRDLARVIDSKLEALNLESQILNLTKEQTADLIQDIQEKNQALLANLEKEKQLIHTQTQEFNDYLNALQKHITAELSLQNQKLKTLILDDVRYEATKKKTPTLERIKHIVTTNLTDSFVDLSRDYKYKIAKKLAQFLDSASLDSGLDSSVDSARKKNLPITNLTTNLATHNAQISQIADILANSIHTLITQSQSKPESSLSSTIKDGFMPLSELIAQKNAQIVALFLDSLNQNLATKKQLLQENIAQTQNNLKNALEKAQNKESQKHSIAPIQNALKEIQNEISLIIKALQ